MTDRKTLDVVAGVVRRAGRFLIARRGAPGDLAGCWEFPGGKIHAGESPAAALRREWREEFDMSVKPGRALGESVCRTGGRTVRLLFMEGQTDDVPHRLAAHDAAVWVYVAMLSRYRFAPADRKMVRHLLKKGRIEPLP